MKISANTYFLACLCIISIYLISCYPQKEILSRWVDGSIHAVRHHKRNNKLNERFVSYYENGKKEYVRYWRGDLLWVYKAKQWYKNGARQLKGWRKYKDTGRKLNLVDSQVFFYGLCKVHVREWYENGKPKYEASAKQGKMAYTYYNDRGIIVKKAEGSTVRPDGYDTTLILLKHYGAYYQSQQRGDSMRYYLDRRQ